MAQTQENLADRRCEACDASTPMMDEQTINAHLKQVPEWSHRDSAIERTFEFKNYYHVMAFVNAVAWIAHCEGHHPDMFVSYHSCHVRLTTHAIGGLSENDFICAAKIDALQA